MIPRIRLIVRLPQIVRWPGRAAVVSRFPVRWPGTSLAVLALAWSAWLIAAPQPVPSPFRAWVGPVERAPAVPKPWPQSLELLAAREVHQRFPRGSTLAQELRRAGVPATTATELVRAAGEVISLRRIRDGQPYRLYFDSQDRLLAFRYEINRQDSWVLSFEEDAWRAIKVTIPVRTRPVYIGAVIVDTLDGALTSATRDAASRNELVLRIADLYGWDIDFNYDLHRGDRLDLLVQERYVDGEFIGYGDILASEFRVGERTIPVVRYQDPDGHSSYFAPDGSSLRRTFLRSPVKYQRISSRFSLRRIHPVTGIPRAHRGVDYVASPGTPVQATADGVVVEAGYRREPGRYVKLKHGGSYSSIYMHLSRIDPRAKVGAQVHQGDVIGYVGKTGNATGYHLHYGLEQGGRYVDPLRLQFPAAEPVPAADWDRFVQQRDQWLSILHERRAANERVAIAGGAGAAGP